MKQPPMALPQPVPVGERYLLVRRLAVGGVADIFLARQSATAGFEKDVVIKRLRPELRGNSRAVRMFLEEARVGALLNHPNVVHVYDVDVADGAPYIAMEYIVGGELGTLCRRGLAQKKFLPLEHGVELMRQAAAGLGYLHAKRSADGQPLQISHRDVSPNNLLVTEDGFLKIIDFGIAKTWRSDAAADRVLPGKLGYLSPEQVARSPVDPRTDIFSLGVVLYEITLGRRLFKGPAHEVVRRIREHVIEPPTFVRRNYPAALEAIVMKALDQAPARRYQSAYDLADDLEQFLQDAKLPSGPVRIARYLDELAHAEGGSRRPELEGSATGRVSRIDLELESAPFRTFRAAPGREWDDAEEPVADVASALGMDVSELRAMRIPPAEPRPGEDAAPGRGGGSGPASAASAASAAPVAVPLSPSIANAAKAAPAAMKAAAPPVAAASPLETPELRAELADRKVPLAAHVDDSGPLLTSSSAALAKVTLDSGSVEALPPPPALSPEPVAGAAAARLASASAETATEAAKAATDRAAAPDGDQAVEPATDPETPAPIEPPAARPAASQPGGATGPARASARGELTAASSEATFGAAFIHRSVPPRSRWWLIALVVALVAFILYINAC